MKLTNGTAMFTGYVTARPDAFVSGFTDAAGMTLTIPTEVLVSMYELCKFDLQQRGQWQGVLERVNKGKENT